MILTPCNGLITPTGAASRRPTFTPASIAGLTLWLKADVGAYQDSGGTTPCTNGTTVAVWKDQSGNGNDASQVTGAARPTFTTGELNGLPGVVFNDSPPTYLATSAFSLPQPCTVAFLAKTLNGSILQYYADGTSLNTRNVLLDPNDTTMSLYAGAVASATTPAQTSFFAAIAVFNNASSVINVMGTETTGLNPGATNGAGVTVGAGAGGTSALKGPMVEVVAYNSALTSGQRAQLMSYLRTRGGI